MYIDRAKTANKLTLMTITKKKRFKKTVVPLL